jgi:hypothetical protein
MLVDAIVWDVILKSRVVGSYIRDLNRRVLFLLGCIGRDLLVEDV